MLLTGGASKAIAVSRKTDRGVTDSDQPIALVPIANGSAVAGTPVDLRCWVGTGGGLVAGSVEALQYLDDIGSVVRVGSDEWVRRLDASGTPELVNLTPHTLDVHDSAVTDAWIKAGEVTVPTNSNGDFSIVFSTPYPTALYAAQMQESGPLTAASISLRWTSEASSKSRITGRAYRSATNAIIPNSAVRVSYVAVGR